MPNRGPRTTPLSFAERLALRRLVDEKRRETIDWAQELCPEGSEWRYQIGCRCHNCKAAALKARRLRRERKRVEEVIAWEREHGKLWPYPIGERFGDVA